MEKLTDNIIQNQTKWPHIFGLTGEEVLEIMEAVREYSLIKDSKSYSDWKVMYNGIHRESTYEQDVRNWLACVRWMKEKKQNRIKRIVESMPDDEDLIGDSKI